MERNILLTIAYDGSVFHGWQRQPNQITVQGYLEKVISQLFKREIILNGTSRTDAGVHALGQRASFKCDVNIPEDRIANVINNALCGREKSSFAIAPVRIVAAEEKPPDFHARFDCRGKKYIYRIKNSVDVDIFSRNYIYHLPERLDIEAMREAAAMIEGTHDFKCFEASGGNPRESTVKTVRSLEILEAGEKVLEIHVTGDGFLYNMVRIITGTLVDIGTGKIDKESVKSIIASKDRRLAGHTAPPYGLYLAEVYY